MNPSPLTPQDHGAPVSFIFASAIFLTMAVVKFSFLFDYFFLSFHCIFLALSLFLSFSLFPIHSHFKSSECCLDISVKLVLSWQTFPSNCSNLINRSYFSIPWATLQERYICIFFSPKKRTNSNQHICWYLCMLLMWAGEGVSSWRVLLPWRLV